jgi:drug/metabolite transporter (DMT)-like permease
MRRAGFALAGVAGALFATGLTLQLRSQALRNDLVPHGDETFSPGDYGKYERVAGASWLGVGSGPLGLAAVLLATAPREHVPWWSYALGVAGLGLVGGGIYELARAGDCGLRDDTEHTCLRTHDTEARGAILLSAALPLIALPITQLLRRRRAGADFALNVRSGPGRAAVVFHRRY